MTRRTVIAALAFLALAPGVRAQELVLEPEGYRTEDYRAPVPETLAGARVLTTAQAEAIWRAKTGVFIDVLPRAPKPKGLPPGTVWRGKTFPAACGCLTQDTASWRRRPRTICDRVLSARPAATSKRCS